MNTTTASCGCQIPALGAPGSMVRSAIESQHCGKPRCESGLPKKFTDRECAAYVWLLHRGIRGWSVDMVTKDVLVPKGDSYCTFTSLVSAAQHHGWEG